MAPYIKQNTIKMLKLMSLLCIISSTQAEKNHSLINHMCNTTYAPNACITCIESTSSDIHSADDVLQGMLGCGENDAMILGQAMNKILDGPTTNLGSTHALFAINFAIRAVIADGGTVQTLAILGQIGDSKSSIETLIMSRLRYCSSVLNESGIIIPSVFSGLFNVEADYKLAYQLIVELSMNT